MVLSPLGWYVVPNRLPSDISTIVHSYPGCGDRILLRYWDEEFVDRRGLRRSARTVWG